MTSPPRLVELMVRPDAFLTSERGQMSWRLQLAAIAAMTFPGALRLGQRLPENMDMVGPILLTGLLTIIALAALSWWLGGAFFRLRILLAGGGRGQRARARACYGWPRAVEASWVAISGVTLASLGEHHPLVLAAGTVSLWAAWASYRGVRAGFPVRVWPARLLFLALPVGLGMAIAYQGEFFDVRDILLRLMAPPGV
jgi:hypothetical protein